MMGSAVHWDSINKNPTKNTTDTIIGHRIISAEARLVRKRTTDIVWDQLSVLR
jgi:hypothetical protein